MTACEDAPAPARSAADLRYAGLEGRISFTNPWFDSPSGQTAHVNLGVDGQTVGRCDRDARDDRTVCAEHSVAPGWHVLSMDFSYAGGDPTKTGPDHLHNEERLLVAADEQVMFDLSKVATGDRTKYVERKKTEDRGSACEVELRALAAAPTCTSAELAKVIPQLASAESTCASLSSAEEVRAGGTVSYAFDNMFAMKADRCFTTIAMGRIPRILTATSGDERWWPKGTLRLGSWGWAHDVMPPGLDDVDRSRAGATKTKMELARGALGKLIERLTVVEDFTSAYEVSKKPQAAVDKALHESFELDPRTPAGHRMHLLLHGPDFARARGEGPGYYDEGFAAFVARSIPRATTLSCAEGQQAPIVLGYLCADKKLTREEWSAIQGLVQRTPSDAKLASACKDVVTEALTSDISASDRLRWLAAWDCAPGRSPAVRGDAIRASLSPSSTKVPADVRTRARIEFAACIGKDEPE